MYTLTKRCRACGYGEPITAPGIKSSAPPDKLIGVFDLGLQPLANDFRKDGEVHSGYAPLQVLFCPNCTLGQLSVTVDPVILYNRYSYITSTSDMMKEHFRLLASELKDYFTPIANVLEIGSNDGSLLKYLRDVEGFNNVYGMDAALNLVEVARKDGIDTTFCLFSEVQAEAWQRHYGAADIILARHVFCHIDDWKDFVRGIKAVSNQNTLIGIEVPYAKKTLENVEFDTVYHEHLSYLTLKSVRALLAGSGLHIHNVTEYSIHGGTIVVWIRRDDWIGEPEPIVDEMIAREKMGLLTWQVFASNAKDAILNLFNRVTELGKKHTICGFGASAKSTVWMNACGFRRRHIKFITDNTPWKQWTTSPGTDIPIVDEGALIREQPDYAILFAWNYAQEIVVKNQEYLNRGGKFIVPIPKIRIIGASS